jgi:predicted permease
MSLILFTLNIVAPIFLLIVIGIFLKRINLINDLFVSQTSKFVFKVSLPALIFLKIASVKITQAFDGKLILTSLILVLIIAGFSWILSSLLTKVPKEKGVFVQGSFRSNFAIIGLALIANLIGEEQLGKASLVLAFVMPLYNILAVIVLTVPFRGKKKYNYFQTIKEIGKNPLIIAALLAAPFSILKVELGLIFITTLTYLSKIALPLALISIGASLNLKSLKEASKLSFIAMFNKLVTFPLLAILVGIYFEFNSNQLTILFILFASPTAIASFIMADAMGSNSKLASDIIVLSTLFSIITLSTGIIIMKYYSFI